MFEGFYKNGSKALEVFYITWRNNEKESWVTWYKENGEIDTAKSDFYKLQIFNKDTVEIGDSLTFRIIYVTQPHDTLSQLVLGDFDVYYNLLDSSSVSIQSFSDSITLSLPAQEKGMHSCRGYFYASNREWEPTKVDTGRILHIAFSYYVTDSSTNKK
jgi:hypothetical protein